MFPEGRKLLGVERAKISYEIAPDQSHWGVEIAGKIKAWAKALVGPTSNPGEYPRMMNAPGSETGPGPQLVTWGKSTVCSVDAFGFSFEWTVNSAKRPVSVSTGMGLEPLWARARLSLRSSRFLGQSLLHRSNSRFAAVFPSIARGPMSELGSRPAGRSLPMTGPLCGLKQTH